MHRTILGRITLSHLVEGTLTLVDQRGTDDKTTAKCTFAVVQVKTKSNGEIFSTKVA